MKPKNPWPETVKVVFSQEPKPKDISPDEPLYRISKNCNTFLEAFNQIIRETKRPGLYISWADYNFVVAAPINFVPINVVLWSIGTLMTEHSELQYNKKRSIGVDSLSVFAVVMENEEDKVAYWRDAWSDGYVQGYPVEIFDNQGKLRRIIDFLDE